MATKQEYERVVAKAKLRGVSSLSSSELHLFKKVLNEVSSLGNEARKLVDG